MYEDDDEAIAFWKQHSSLPDERIQRLGKDTNYWSTGQPGPAGPCSEIFFDRGPEYGIDGGPATDDDRYVEIWNLVFMQYQIADVRSKYDFTITGELPNKNIDTGMGLERVAFIKQGVDNMYEIDQVRPVLDEAARISGRRYGAVHEDDVRMRVIADHVRSSLMLVTDGVTPSNEGRGYILRRLLRRTVRAMRLLGVEGATFPQLFPASRDAMQEAYPEVASDFDRIARIAYAEEETFLRTLAQGTTILDVAVERAKQDGAPSIGGDTAFLLHDTFGFPIDLTMEMADEAGVQVDRGAFETLMSEQRARAKADAKSKKTALADLSVYSAFRAKGETVFLGYDALEAESAVLGIIVGGTSVDRAVAGDIAEVILGETSLYAESGGQDADQGSIVGNGFDLEVLDVQRPVAGLWSHTVQVRSGEVGVGDAATTVVDAEYRRGATQAHSATHLVNAALRDVLGPEALQAGSYNKSGYMRLDFSWSQPVSGATRSEIEEVVNAAIRSDLAVQTRCSRSTRPRRSARRRCSARSTAARSAWSTSAARGRASSAVARTWRPARRSASSTWWGSRASARPTAASRPSSASRASATSPSSGRSSRSSRARSRRPARTCRPACRGSWRTSAPRRSGSPSSSRRTCSSGCRRSRGRPRPSAP